jgi:uncharacterized protein YkwD
MCKIGNRKFFRYSKLGEFMLSKKSFSTVFSLIMLVLVVLPVREVSAKIAAPSLISLTTCSEVLNNDFEIQLVKQINELRKKASIPALILDSRVMSAAHVHAVDMACTGKYSHTGSDGSTLTQRLNRYKFPVTLAVENIMRGASTPSDAIANWLVNALTKENIFSRKYKYIGTGYAKTAANGIFFTVVFAK